VESASGGPLTHPDQFDGFDESASSISLFSAHFTNGILGSGSNSRRIRTTKSLSSVVRNLTLRIVSGPSGIVVLFALCRISATFWSSSLVANVLSSASGAAPAPGMTGATAIVAGILVARHLKTADDLFGGPQGSPRTDKLIAASIQWAERIMTRIDEVFGK
jgi:hypothetical protein